MLESFLHLAAIALFLVTLPGTIELALFTIGALLPEPRKTSSPIAARDFPLAVIIPVYNEERGLPATVKSVLACDDPLPPENIVVMACNTTDRSTAIAREFGCTVLERTDPQRRGKGYGLDYAFQNLEGRGFDAYVIIDADTIVAPNFISAYRDLFAGGAKAGQCVLRVADPASSTRTRLLNIAFLAFTFLRPLARHRLGLSAGIFGNGFGVRADTVKQVPYHCYSIAEDLEYHTQLIRAGVRVEFVRDTSVATDMRTTETGAKSQRERWEGGRLRIMFEQAPLLVRDIVVRGRWRLIEPLLDLLLLPLTYHLLFLGLLMLLASGPLLAYALLGYALVVVHVLQGMLLGQVGAGDWKALASVPGYIGWKLLNVSGILKTASKSAPWRRTERRHF